MPFELHFQMLHSGGPSLGLTPSVQDEGMRVPFRAHSSDTRALRGTSISVPISIHFELCF
jgi:hypothetical protein